MLSHTVFVQCTTGDLRAGVHISLSGLDLDWVLGNFTLRDSVAKGPSLVRSIIRYGWIPVKSTIYDGLCIVKKSFPQ